MKPPRRIPTKQELERLQRLYKTDEKIAERMGDVPAYLVAYWRRKKNVPAFSAPKFSDKEIRELWERFGDDYRCGAEIGLSKAAFYSWRRRYKILDKPAFLKLEQMELLFPGREPGPKRLTDYGKRPAIHKALWLKSPAQNIRAGESVTIAPDVVVLERHAAQTIADTKGADALRGAARIAVGGPERLTDPVSTWLRRQQNRIVTPLALGSVWERLARLGHLAPGRVIACEPGAERFVGAWGALGIPLSSTAIGAALHSGQLSLSAPHVHRVTLTGKRYRAISATDITLHLCAYIDGDTLAESALEFHGPSLNNFTIQEREALCGAGAFISIVTAITPFDIVTKRAVADRDDGTFHALTPDKDAEFAGLYQLNIEQAEPMVALRQKANPLGAAKVSFHPVSRMSQTPVAVIFIGGAPGGSFNDLVSVAEVLRGRTVAEDVTLFISPISREALTQALKRGIVRQLVDAGATLLPVGWDSADLEAFGVGDIQRVMTTNFEPAELGGGRGERLYVSPITAAASAVTGLVTDPRGY